MYGLSASVSGFVLGIKWRKISIFGPIGFESSLKCCLWIVNSVPRSQTVWHFPRPPICSSSQISPGGNTSNFRSYGYRNTVAKNLVSSTGLFDNRDTRIIVLGWRGPSLAAPVFTVTSVILFTTWFSISRTSIKLGIPEWDLKIKSSTPLPGRGYKTRCKPSFYQASQCLNVWS